ncbi:uncharacterized protein F4807DRAFT_405609 [Annulohypoxylon truncatum]|uniref:uncharacterized protein n=1 Tax=Annulohypoxylon truncatum TaxID=327061 RepID=UPI00200884C2|nr:uncharacterized protein F4807DRAFT_405609 [Annulohypoxylon truncatum]KAI1215036.1 hypothetical protein F4807DRAFT_405609 [Annulohypoxylon truncatum]
MVNRRNNNGGFNRGPNPRYNGNGNYNPNYNQGQRNQGRQRNQRQDPFQRPPPPQNPFQPQPPNPFQQQPPPPPPPSFYQSPYNGFQQQQPSPFQTHQQFEAGDRHYHTHNHYYYPVEGSAPTSTSTPSFGPQPAPPTHEDVTMAEASDLDVLQDRIASLTGQIREILQAIAGAHPVSGEVVTAYVNAVREWYPDSELARALQLNELNAEQLGRPCSFSVL